MLSLSHCIVFNDLKQKPHGDANWLYILYVESLNGYKSGDKKIQHKVISNPFDLNRYVCRTIANLKAYSVKQLLFTTVELVWWC